MAYKKGLAIILCLALCAGLFVASASAESYSVNPDFLVPVVPDASTSTPLSSMFPVYTYTKNDIVHTVAICIRNSSAGITVCVGYPGYFLILSTSQPSGYYVQVNEFSGGGSNSNSYNTITVDGVIYYQYQRAVSSYFTEFLCPSFSDYSSALAACISALDYHLYSTVTFTLPAGNVAYIEIPAAGADGSMYTSFSELSGFLNHSWMNLNQCTGIASSLPSESLVVSLGETIPWERYGSTNALGQTRSAKFDFIVIFPNSSSRYLVVSNPLYRYIPDLVYPWQETFSNVQYNGDITITISPASSVRVYPMRDTVGESGVVLSSLDPEVYFEAVLPEPEPASEPDPQDPNSGSSVEDSHPVVIVTWEDPSGSTNSSPSYGGDNYLDTDQSTSNGLFSELLSKIASLLGTLVGGVINAITSFLSKILDSLIRLAAIITEKGDQLLEVVLGWFDALPQLYSGFTDFLSSTFSFLPGNLLLIMEFGLAAMITVGIIKVVRK